ncbi:MAG: hypothetical protein HRU29_08920 [Rhizobiales bacterium]|nr:hypothetical protein [Hyphomicrobiales bacterium]NRB14510.1 hypothetical protein [Hyphomicrobiales bacterium]
METNDQTSRFTTDLYLVLKNSLPTILKSFSKLNQIYLVKDFALADTAAYFSRLTESIYFPEASFVNAIRHHDEEIFFISYADLSDYMTVDLSFISNDNLPRKFSYSFATTLYHELAHFIEYSTLSVPTFGCLDVNIFSKIILYEMDFSEGRSCDRNIY